mmetsp:Transcript_69057/g.225147  ORF Transcript_69057/g.225147 Transcript_69057/m.225147 type:complete len:418 (+) Transcript_69057:62-1315(+)
MASLYDVLEVEVGASGQDIRAAFKRRALAVHPDKGGCKEDFQRVLLAFETLSDSTVRAKYDARQTRNTCRQATRGSDKRCTQGKGSVSTAPGRGTHHERAPARSRTDGAVDAGADEVGRGAAPARGSGGENPSVRRQGKRMESHDVASSEQHRAQKQQQRSRVQRTSKATVSNVSEFGTSATASTSEAPAAATASDCNAQAGHGFDSHGEVASCSQGSTQATRRSANHDLLGRMFAIMQRLAPELRLQVIREVLTEQQRRALAARITDLKQAASLRSSRSITRVSPSGSICSTESESEHSSAIGQLQAADLSSDEQMLMLENAAHLGVPMSGASSGDEEAELCSDIDEADIAVDALEEDGGSADLDGRLYEGHRKRAHMVRLGTRPMYKSRWLLCLLAVFRHRRSCVPNLDSATCVR